MEIQARGAEAARRRFRHAAPARTPFEKGPLTDALFLLHRGGCALLAGLVGLHVLAVIKHQFVSRNNVLRRML